MLQTDWGVSMMGGEAAFQKIPMVGEKGEKALALFIEGVYTRKILETGVGVK